LTAGDAIVSGTATKFRAHPSSGALVAGAADISGTAARVGAPVTHDSSGAMEAGSASMDGVSELLSKFRGGAPGGRRQKYVIYIDGKRFVGYEDEIYLILKELAKADAETISEGEKPPKRRIVVQVGKARQVSTVESAAQIVLPDFKAMQFDFRRVYLAELASEQLLRQMADELDDEEILLLI
jgi:hypothetical protein